MIENESVSQNITSTNERHIPAVAFVSIQIIILILSLVGNAIVILIVIKKRRMQSFTNWLILNLAVADIYSVLICIPLEIPIDLGSDSDIRTFADWRIPTPASRWSYSKKERAADYCGRPDSHSLRVLWQPSMPHTSYR